MKTSEFLSLLKQHQNKSLLFEYAPDQLVGANYHITEVKNITIDSVDCGAGTDFWKETIVQLWESPKEKEKTEFMSTYKALGILNKVDKIKPMDKDTEIKFEYSNDHFHTAQLFVNDFDLDETSLIMKLSVEKTDCKAKETCGVVPTVAEIEKEACCTPGSGCC
ncbi:DUF6428 family protein [Flagellimonas pelagia]|uniref:Uncharacterized protein n=1 Tax=Flagellimonas pelagia TaxID=2306998 RepID=A0A3A1NLS6_9FLAO|nr:DUF6428 family protein [Allomuricauda maritima]RIV46503.1 hypothetical protein D2V05_03930 [Allomuricauda maritima]TXJ99165.1 hypothetical protein FQ017_03905 [Allomuricauda maritima]